MSEPFLAEIKIVGFTFAPRGWALCDGQLLPISQNQSLFSLLGTTYGGDGRTTFALPDLRGRTPVHSGQGQSFYPLGTERGSEQEFLTVSQIPQHTHSLSASSQTADAAVPTNHALAAGTIPEAYRDPESLTSMRAGTVSSVGSGQSHTNMQPYIVVNFCIALTGVFPSRN